MQFVFEAQGFIARGTDELTGDFGDARLVQRAGFGGSGFLSATPCFAVFFEFPHALPFFALFAITLFSALSCFTARFFALLFFFRLALGLGFGSLLGFSLLCAGLRGTRGLDCPPLCFEFQLPVLLRAKRTPVLLLKLALALFREASFFPFGLGSLLRFRAGAFRFSSCFFRFALGFHALPAL